ncbi:MAG: hypothetical protein MSS16_03875 [Streptococcus orisratti]|uniref:hypothetical protein n=1 Tax=Streptococcus orisratti TaxID=114652 RepID=UPI002356CCE4|nr:hypothetical protein [Streptococcus orisratti]MCI7677216.1 hypothetical protein [Streptococcus orisratti]MDY5635313.1 hypothetical protein [Streptococcus orisratti]
MIADIRIRSDGNSQFLCQLDLMKYSEEQVRDRMSEKGISDDTFFICGFTDWEIDNQMSLKEAYQLKRCIVEVYDGDEYLVIYQLKKGASLLQIFSNYYRFVSRDELVTMQYLLRDVSVEDIVKYFFATESWVNALNNYVLQGVLLNTPKGFYVSVTV